MSESVKKARRYKHAPHTAWRRVDDETIILDLNSSVYYSLNDTGSLIWERLEKGAEPESIAAELCAEFSVQPDAASRDIAQIVASLHKENLLIPA